MKKSSVSWAALLLVLMAWLVLALPVTAGTVTVSKTPPGVTSKVAPNIVVTFDDSGSMNATSIPDTMDANYGNKYYYSALGNPIYFDPTVTYVVPPDASGAPLGTPTFKAAWRDGYCANTLTKKCWSPNNAKYLDPIVVDLSTSFYAGFLANIQAGNSPCSRNANELTTWSSGNTCLQMDIPASVRGTSTKTSSSTSSSSTSCFIVCGAFNGASGTKTITTTTNNADGSVSVSVSVGNCTTTLSLITTCSSIVTTITTTTTITTQDTGGFYYVCTQPANDATAMAAMLSLSLFMIMPSQNRWFTKVVLRDALLPASLASRAMGAPDTTGFQHRRSWPRRPRSPPR